jgi:hypothetical protein
MESTSRLNLCFIPGYGCGTFFMYNCSFVLHLWTVYSIHLPIYWLFSVNIFYLIIYSEFTSLIRWIIAKIFFHPGGCLFTLIIIFIAVQKIINLMQSHFTIRPFTSWAIEALCKLISSIENVFFLKPDFFSSVLAFKKFSPVSQVSLFNQPISQVYK